MGNVEKSNPGMFIIRPKDFGLLTAGVIGNMFSAIYAWIQFEIRGQRGNDFNFQGS